MKPTLREGSPEEAGVRPEMVDRIRRRAEEWIDGDLTQSLCLLLARKGVIFLHEAWGPLTHEPDSPPLTVDALFGIASVTKTITATAAMDIRSQSRKAPISALSTSVRRTGIAAHPRRNVASG